LALLCASEVLLSLATDQPVLQIGPHGRYSVSVGGQVWFQSAPTTLHHGGQWYSSNPSGTDKQLVLTGTRRSSGEDAMGAYNATVLVYQAGSATMESHFRQFADAILFEQVSSHPVAFNGDSHE
jgi:hypothetical protein